MNCPSCGKQTGEQDRFCLHCGTFLPESEPAETASAPPQQDQPETATGLLEQDRLRQPSHPSAPAPSADPAQPGTAAPSDRPKSSSAGDRGPSQLKADAPQASDYSGPSGGSAPARNRWTGFIILLLALFGLAGAGGYLLQRSSFFADRTDTPPEAAGVEGETAVEGTSAELPEAEADLYPGGPPPPDPAGSPESSGLTGNSEADPSGGATKATASANRPRPPKPAQPSSPRPSEPPAASVEKSEDPPSQPAGTSTQIAPPTKPSPSSSFSGGQSADLAPPDPAVTKDAPEDDASPLVSNTAPETPPERPRPATKVLNPTGQAPGTGRSRPPGPGPGAPKAASPDSGGSSATNPGSPRPVVPEQAPAPPPARREGTIYWTGRLQKDQVIVIEGQQASVGRAEGSLLPGTPVDVWMPSTAVTLVERPSAENNWSRVTFRCARNTDRPVTINVQWRRLQ